MTTPADLIAAALSSVFSGDTPTLRTSYDRWTHDGNAAGGIDAQRRPTVAIRNDASTRLGVNAEPKFVTIVESPALYVGMGDGSDEQVISYQKFVPDRTGVIYEYRYGVDREMREATPYMAAFDGNQKNLYTIDSFPTSDVLKNWLSTAPSSIRLSTSNADALKARQTPASNNQDKIYEQQELAELIGAYRSHPLDSKLRNIRYIAAAVLPDDTIYGTGTTTEQRRRLPKEEYQGSNYVAEDTEDAALFSIDRTTGAATMIAEYNGTFWNSALLKQVHLLAFNEGSSILYGIMPPGSHQSYLDAAEVSGDQHIGTLVSINRTTAEITEVGALYWTPGTDGYDSVQIKSFTYDQIDGDLRVIIRTNDGADPQSVGHSLYTVDPSTPALTTEEYTFSTIVYSDEDSLKNLINIRAIANRGVSGRHYVIASKGIGEMQNPQRFLYDLDIGGGTLTEIGAVRQTSIDSFVFFPAEGYFGVDTDTHELVQIHENFNKSGVVQREMGALVVDVFDTGATDEVIYTQLNIENSRAMDYHDVMVVTLESDEVGELLQIEFGSSNSKIDGRSPVISEPGRQPDIQVQKVNFREADKQIDVYINIKGSTFQEPARDEMRYIGFRVKDARKPFTFKVNRIQLMKLDADPVLDTRPPMAFLESNKQFVQFSVNDKRRTRWFVQIRAILLTEVPPISPRIKDAVSHSNHSVAVINHPHRRLRGGRMVTPHLNDAALGLLNPGYSQTPAKIPGAYISDGYGVDPAVEPIRDPLLFFGSGGAIKTVDAPFPAVPESTLIANAGILLWMNPSDDVMYVDAGVTLLNKAGGQQNCVRWIPGVKPSTLDYFEDGGADYAQWLPGASGINGNPVVVYTGTQALHDDVDAPAQTFRTSDMFDADSGVFAFAGKRTGTHATTDLKAIQDGFANAMYLEMLSTASGGGTRLVMDMASDVVLNTPPDGNGLLSVVAWLHGTDVDWWLNGTKQTQVTGVGTLSVLTRTAWSIRNFFGTTFMLLRHGTGKAVGATEADMAALAAHLETLLGR